MECQALRFVTGQSEGILKEVVDATVNDVIDEMTDCHVPI
jgi:hypothetical protein